MKLTSPSRVITNARDYFPFMQSEKMNTVYTVNKSIKQ